MGESYMQKIINTQLIEMILRLNLSKTIIADEETTYTMTFKRQISEGIYLIRVNTREKNICHYNKFEIELKGTLDVDFVKYVGKIELEPAEEGGAYYKMSHVRLFKIDHREHERVPYVRPVEVIAPIKTNGTLVNISATGAMIEFEQKLQCEEFDMEVSLAKKLIKIRCIAVDTYYDEVSKHYCVRCYFDNVSKRDKMHISRVVKEIIMMHKLKLSTKK